MSSCPMPMLTRFTANWVLRLGQHVIRHWRKNSLCYGQCRPVRGGHSCLVNRLGSESVTTARCPLATCAPQLMPLHALRLSAASDLTGTFTFFVPLLTPKSSLSFCYTIPSSKHRVLRRKISPVLIAQ